MRKPLFYIIPVLLGFMIGFISHYFQTDAIHNWYPYLDKPALTPPNWIFPIAWGIIYVMSGISLGIVWNSKAARSKELIGVWAFQLVLNLTWSILFFYLQNPFAGLINILLLDVVAIWYTVRSYKVSRIASYLFYIYIAWLMFATYLNFYIMLHN